MFTTGSFMLVQLGPSQQSSGIDFNVPLCRALHKGTLQPATTDCLPASEIVKLNIQIPDTLDTALRVQNSLKKGRASSHTKREY
jgi:hypothetical protein